MDISTEQNNLSKTDILTAYFNCLRHYGSSFLRYMRRYRNFIVVAYQVLRNRYPIQAVLRDGSKRQYFNPNEIWLDLANIKYDHEKNVVFIDDIELAGGTTNGDIFNIFFKKEYDVLPVEDRIIMDIGANIADSSIYFASKGAKKIYAAEPNGELYELAKQNINISKFSNRIQIIWGGCSSKTCENNDPPLLSLETLMGKFEITPDILKIDCEGCEYDVILNSTDDLIGSFKYILIEYHHGYKNLKRKLERCGFSVTVSMPRYCKLNNTRSNLNIQFSNDSRTLNKKCYVGMILGRKNRTGNSLC
jgi:hypothetical protein